MFSLWNRIQDIQRDSNFLLACANACARAYAEATGQTHQPFDASNAAFPANCVGLQTVVTVLPIIALLRGRTFENMEQIIPQILQELAHISVSSGDPERILQELSEYPDTVIAAIVANGLWNLTKDFANKPGRHNNFPVCVDVELFQRIPKAQGLIGLDFIQVKTAAQFLLEKL
ncbi:hypothetical protein KSF_107400 [Reticulibacter mediterranei]|uniref:Uncharacterized protein n=1 Tax=Reticulibacter mediterranei TaxID=2778369 RepID=A0A8J3J1M0_9CHLR|nr:hypothetical protein [Reticulibacter mediterranei]GHP00693.1 hypothetical protein KSF_107400 [Reticulibacter mediterranei]